MNRSLPIRFLGALGALALVVVVASLATGCRSFEHAGQSLDTGLRNTGQDLQHGIRGEPDPNDAPRASAQPQPAPPPQPPSAPAPATSANGVSL